MLVTLFWAVIIFCFLIFVHEFGHFITAKAVGIRVNEFAIGMGPILYKKKKGDTEYSLRAFPIGGFVKMEGEEENSDDPSAFNNKPTWAKAIVVVAGSLMNLLTTIIILSLILFFLGFPTNTINELTLDKPAIEAGLLPGDEIVKLNNTEISSWDEIVSNISNSTGDQIAITINRDGEEIKIISDVATDETGRRIIGVTPTFEKNPMMAVSLGISGTFEMAVMMLDYLGKLVTGQGSTADLMGPVGIVSTIGDFAQKGFAYLANLTALISLNLAIVNMLPFPALDGGRLTFMLIRKFTGKAITDEVENKIHFAGLMLLFSLMIWVTVQDVGKFVVK
jgi:regulator of sigma E protease